MKKRISTVLASLLLLSLLAAAAQEQAPAPMREELIKLNYIRLRGSQIQSLLLLFLSREGQLRLSESENMISLKDHAPNVEKILAFIKKLDVKPADILFTVQLVLAASGEDIRSDKALASDPVIKELKSLLKYKNFALLDTSLVRAMDGEQSTVTMGAGTTEFTLHLVPDFIREGASEIIKLEVVLRQRKEPGPAPEGVTPEPQVQRTVLESNLSFKPGDKTVVGVSKLDGGDKAVILILSGKVLS